IAGWTAGERRGELLEGCARVGDQGQAGVLEGIELGDVDVQEPDVLVLERRLGRGGEVAQACSDGDHQVGLAGGDVRAGRPGDSDRAEVHRVIERQRALAGLRLADGDTRLRGEARQDL